MINLLDVTRDWIAIPAPPGQEDLLRVALQEMAESLGFHCRVDAAGNIAFAGHPDAFEQAKTVVLAHMDELALLVTRIEPDGQLSVTGMGGVFPWKWGECTVDVLVDQDAVPGILSFGSIHSESTQSAAVRAKSEALTWSDVSVFTGRTHAELCARGVTPGCRVVLEPAGRVLTELGDYVAGRFLDDRADLAAMFGVMSSADWTGCRSVVFAATVSEEVGGLGAQYLLRQQHFDVAIALEIGPIVPDAPAELTSTPTLWVRDSFCAMQARDIRLVNRAAEIAGTGLQHQALSRGGSDASCCAAAGLVARPITLAFPALNSHGMEIMHRDAPSVLAALTHAVLNELAADA